MATFRETLIPLTLWTLTFLILNPFCKGQVGIQSVEQCSEGRTLIDVDDLVTMLQSPSRTYTNPQCSFRFRKEPNICQIRLDFMYFETNGASSDGICETDKLIISNSITVENGFTTCGDLTGQHMYLTFGQQDTIEVTSILNTMSGSSYGIVATKISCDSSRRAPDYCLQHFTNGYGTVTSFDFPRQQQSNQQYTVCVKPQPRSSRVVWMPCGMRNAFDVTSNFGGVEQETCMTDWVQVKGLNRICDIFPSVESTWKPYDLLVNFDEAEFPPVFYMPITGPCDATNCGGWDSSLICSCVAMLPTTVPDTCQCTMDYSVIGAPTPDFNNTGFCLRYSQL